MVWHVQDGASSRASIVPPMADGQAFRNLSPHLSQDGLTGGGEQARAALPAPAVPLRPDYLADLLGHACGYNRCLAALNTYCKA